MLGDPDGGRSDRQHGGHPRADTVEEVFGDARRTVFRRVAFAGSREDPVRDVADERDRGAGAHGGQVHGESIGETLALAEEQLVGAHGSLALRVEQQGRADDADALAAEAETLEGIPGACAALEGGPDQFGAEPALHVGTGTNPQHVQGDEFGGILKSGRAFVGQGAVHRRPDRPEHLVASPHREGDALRGQTLVADLDGVDDHRLVVAVQVAEHAALGEHP